MVSLARFTVEVRLLVANKHRCDSTPIRARIWCPRNQTRCVYLITTQLR